MRTIQTTTVLGTIAVRRAYYLCATCRQGVAPVDRQLGLCAGGFSAGLDELLAFLGVRSDSFEEAAETVAK